MCKAGRISSTEEDDSSVSEVDMTDSSSDSEEDNAVTSSIGNPDGEDDEDDLVKAIRLARSKPSEHPPEIDFEDLIVDISFHPKEDVLAAASITGDVFLYKYSNEANELLETWELHTKACRDIEYSDDGSLLYSCAKDRCIMITDTQTGKLTRFYEEAHDEPLYCLYVFNENCICTGDESGVVKMWDIRQEKPIVSFKEMEDFVSDIITTEARKYLVCSSGDGSLTTFNMSSRKLYVQSEEYDAELTSMQLFKHETKLLVGTSKGKTYLFNWGEFGYHSDEFIGPKHSVNCIKALTEHIALAGSDDGSIRSFNLFPHHHLGVVGQHEFSVESMDISNNGEFIASSALDQKVRFWNIKYFENINITHETNKSGLRRNLPSSRCKDSSDFFSGLA